MNKDFIDKVLRNINSLQDNIFKKINYFIALKTKKNSRFTNYNIMYMNITQLSFTVIKLILNVDIENEQKVNLVMNLNVKKQ